MFLTNTQHFFVTDDTERISKLTLLPVQTLSKLHKLLVEKGRIWEGGGGVGGEWFGHPKLQIPRGSKVSYNNNILN
jgi:hypothetical protein